MSLKKENAIRKEHRVDKWNSYYIYVFNCISCSQAEVFSRNPPKHDGLCTVCAHHTNRPFEGQYKVLKKDSRGHSGDLSYEEFIEFTKIKNCHYCDDGITWIPYPTVNNTFISRAYYLDRMDNKGPYKKDNCVVCCTDCNRIKGNRFDYEEMMKLSPSLKDIKKSRTI